MTTAQLLLVKTEITADSALNSQPQTPDGAEAITKALNSIAVPDFWVWKTTMTKAEALQQLGPEGTIFTWAGNGFITRTAGEQQAFEQLFYAGVCNPSLSNVRQAFTDIFSGTGNAALNRTHLAAVGRRKATRVEKVLATGTGSTASPAVMGHEGAITYRDVQQARAI